VFFFYSVTRGVLLCTGRNVSLGQQPGWSRFSVYLTTTVHQWQKENVRRQLATAVLFRVLIRYDQWAIESLVGPYTWRVPALPTGSLRPCGMFHVTTDNVTFIAPETSCVMLAASACLHDCPKRGRFALHDAWCIMPSSQWVFDELLQFYALKLVFLFRLLFGDPPQDAAWSYRSFLTTDPSSPLVVVQPISKLLLIFL